MGTIWFVPGSRSETPGDGVRALPPPRARLPPRSCSVRRTAARTVHHEWWEPDRCATPRASPDVEGAVLGACRPRCRWRPVEFSALPVPVPEELVEFSVLPKPVPEAVVPFSVLPEPTPVELVEFSVLPEPAPVELVEFSVLPEPTPVELVAFSVLPEPEPETVVPFSVLPVPGPVEVTESPAEPEPVAAGAVGLARSRRPRRRLRRRSTGGGRRWRRRRNRCDRDSRPRSDRSSRNAPAPSGPRRVLVGLAAVVLGALCVDRRPCLHPR